MQLWHRRDELRARGINAAAAVATAAAAPAAASSLQVSNMGYK
jgi:hypothetical protein